METRTVARNYAEVFHALATKAGDPEGWGAMLDAVAHVLTTDPTFRLYLESPKVDTARKQAAVVRALDSVYPKPVVKFVSTVIGKKRHAAIGAIAFEYRAILDAAAGRMHATVTVARPIDEAQTAMIAAQLSKAFQAAVSPKVVVDPAILGGAVIRVGDQVIDGSVRKRIGTLRRRMLGTAR